MSWIEGLRFRTKVWLVSIAGTCVALLLAGFGLAASDLFTTRMSTVARLSADAARIAMLSTAAVRFNDEVSASETLAFLRTDPHVMIAAVYVEDGSVLATYSREGSVGQLPRPPRDQESRIVGGEAEVFSPIVLGERRIGTVYVRRDLRDVAERFRNYVATTAVVLLLSFIVAGLGVSRLEGVITEPVNELLRTARDITERRDYSVRAEEISRDELGTLTKAFNEMLEQIQSRDAEIRASASMLAEAEYTAKLGSWEWVFETRTISWSEEMYRIFERNRADGPLTTDQFVERIHPDDRDRIAAELTPTFRSPGPATMEYRILMPDGRVKTLRTTAHLDFNDDGTRRRSAGSVQDVSARRQAEQALRESEQHLSTILAASPVGIVQADAAGAFTFGNTWIEEISGLPIREATGDSWLQSIHPDDRDRVTELLRRAIVRDIEVSTEYRLLRHDGEVVWVMLRSTPEHDAEGKVVGSISTLSDITERKEAESKIAQLNIDLEVRVQTRTAELQAANKELESFSYSVSHDLRGPLRAIAGFSRILIDEHTRELGEDACNYLQRIEAATTKLERLISDLLTMARVTRAEIERQKIDLSALARDIVDDLYAQDRGRDVEFQVNSGISGEGDGALLRMVLENLLGNAWKFSSERPKAHIEFGMTVRNRANAYFVKDDGVGFDTEFADQLFQPFTRLHADRDFEGTGIGLATVQRIIERHGGRVWAESRVDEGATFYFTLAGV